MLEVERMCVWVGSVPFPSTAEFRFVPLRVLFGPQSMTSEYLQAVLVATISEMTPLRNFVGNIAYELNSRLPKRP